LSAVIFKRAERDSEASLVESTPIFSRLVFTRFRKGRLLNDISLAFHYLVDPSTDQFGDHQMILFRISLYELEFGFVQPYL